MLMLIYTCNSV